MTVYIAGPMRGYENYNTEAFNDMQKRLEDFGYIVLNPAVLPKTLKENQYLPICLSMLEQCDAIVLLKGWEKSVGAQAECAYAVAQNKMILTVVG